jgi:hypothetical protein
MALALEPRFKTGVLICGGLLSAPQDGELEQLNFASRVRIPILMVGGKDDFMRPRCGLGWTHEYKPCDGYSLGVGRAEQESRKQENAWDHRKW